MSKWDGAAAGQPEWIVALDATENLTLFCYDQSATAQCLRATNAALSVGWHHFSIVGDFANGGGATQMNNVLIYVDGVVVASTATNSGAYVGMENLTALPKVGCFANAGANTGFFAGDMGRLFVTAEALTAAQVWRIYEKTRGFYNK
jgi:hypothetical protein